MREWGRIRIEDGGFDEVLLSFTMNDSAFHTYRRAGGNWSAVIHLQVPRHSRETPRADRLAHGFIEQSGYDSAMKEAGMAFEPIRNAHWAYDCAILREKELKLQAGGIRLTAAEAAILCCMCKRSEIVEVRLHH